MLQVPFLAYIKEVLLSLFQYDPALRVPSSKSRRASKSLGKASVAALSVPPPSLLALLPSHLSLALLLSLSPRSYYLSSQLSCSLRSSANVFLLSSVILPSRLVSVQGLLWIDFILETLVLPYNLLFASSRPSLTCRSSVSCNSTVSFA